MRKIVLAALCALALALPGAAVAGATATSAGKEATMAPVQQDATNVGAFDGTRLSGDKAAAEEDGQPVVCSPSEELLAWADGRDCKMCHQAEVASLESEDCAVFIHVQLKMECTTCHVDDAIIDQHEKVDEKSKAPGRLKKTKVPQEVCMTCHVAENLIETTADCTVLTDDEGTTVNPHDLPVNKDHEATTCTSCHNMHSDKPVEKSAPAHCATCHHDGVYECGTCHS